MDIKRISSIEEADICDNFLTGLIKYESSIDNLINNDYVAKDFYRRALNNDNQYAIYGLDKVL